MSELKKKLETVKLAIDERIELHNKITTAGTPPHSDFWGQSIFVANEKIRSAYSDLNNYKYF